MKKIVLLLLAGIITFSSTLPMLNTPTNDSLSGNSNVAGSGEAAFIETPPIEDTSMRSGAYQESVRESSEFVYYNQLDEQWANHAYGKGTIGETGCGPVNLAMVVSTLTDEDVDPIIMADWAYKNGFRAKDGSYHSIIPKGAEEYGLSVECGIRDRSELIKALSAGKLIVVIMGKGHFTASGHFITITGLDPQDRRKVQVADSASLDRTKVSWDLDLIMKEAQSDATTDGGPFWIVSK